MIDERELGPIGHGESCWGGGRLSSPPCRDALERCWRSLTTIFRRQLDQKIMRVCISYMHPYPIKFLNYTLPFRICKLCFQANMQVTSTLWPDTKSQKISEYQFRLKWTKWSPRTKANPAGAGRASDLALHRGDLLSCLWRRRMDPWRCALITAPWMR